MGFARYRTTLAGSQAGLIEAAAFHDFGLLEVILAFLTQSNAGHMNAAALDGLVALGICG